MVTSRPVPLALALLALACKSRPSPTEASHMSLGGDTVARVGDVVIPVTLVARVAGAQHVSPHEALGSVVEDALAAAGARAAGLDLGADVKAAKRSARARLVLRHLREEARAAGPPTNEEVNSVSEQHWLDVDLPEQMRVIHAVVIDPKKPELQAQAAALALVLAATEASSTSEDDFEARAKALPHDEKLEIKVERLAPFVGDGRIASPGGGTLDLDFVRGATPLAPSATSKVVRSRFGWHVIRMIERFPEHRIPFEERRALFEEEVQTIRARRAKDKLTEELADKYGVTVSNGVEELMTSGTMTFLGVGRAPDPRAP